MPVSPVPFAAEHAGYITIAFPQDAGTVCALIVRPSADHELADLRHEPVFQRVTSVIPNLAPWTDLDRFEPITPVMAGAGLTNTYRSHLDDRGRVALAGLLCVGDAVSTTNPAAGRGVSLGLLQAQAMVRLIDAGTDLRCIVTELDRWCADNIRPWYDDHRYWDATLLRRFRSGRIDLDARIPSDVIAAAAERLPQIAAAAGRYRAMLAPPSVLQPHEDAVRTLLRSGWRPPVAPGPSRDELADLVRTTDALTPA